MDDRLDEILHRLRDLDDRLSRLEGRRRDERDCGPRRNDRDCGPPRDRNDHDRHRGSDRGRDQRDFDRSGRGRHGDHGGRDGRDGDGFDEKRVIDTIVRLVCENVGPIVGEAVARELDRRQPRDEPEGDGK